MTNKEQDAERKLMLNNRLDEIKASLMSVKLVVDDIQYESGYTGYMIAMLQTLHMNTLNDINLINRIKCEVNNA